MTYSDLLIRHVPADVDRAEQLVQALAGYGYRTELTTSPVEQNYPHLVIWSPASINDDDLIWECTRFARVDSSGQPAPIYQAILGPVAARPAIHPHFSGASASAPHLHPIDLSEWDGDPQDDQLAQLIWSMPQPAAPSAAPPHPRAETRDEAHWRPVRARRDLLAMAAYLRLRIAPSRREDAAKYRAQIEEMRAIGVDPEAWVRFGPRTAAAAAQGPEGLRAWADEINQTHTIPDPDAPDHMRTITAFANLQFAIQIYAGANKQLTFTQDIRTEEEILALIEAGDSETISKFRYDRALIEKARPAIERLASENHPAALTLSADLPGTPDYRRRLLLEKAAALGDTYAIGALVRTLEIKRKFRETIPLLRRGAELGDSACKQALAEALDEGKRVKRDAKGAFQLYTQLGEGDGWGDRQLAMRVAQMQWDGDGCPRDRDKAVHAFFDLHIGEEAPYAVAIFIGDLYRDGLGGIAKDREEAIGWYRTATIYNGIEAAIGRKRLKEMKVRLTEQDGEDDEFDEEEREQLRKFWRARA